jgi:2-polyprenyl-3-methyl-5-hydroxy-6-metoxy-1,4-benzoquinol methylase
MGAFQSHPSSYRDPSGFLFYQDGILFRQVNRRFAEAFEQFERSGLSKHLTGKGLLTQYEIINENLSGSDDWYLTIKPEPISFISYPYEWCFGMLKDAALATLEIAFEALSFNMMLKDASAYNLQWHDGRMQFIDTLSFEPYNEQKPWIAYRQFCEHFLAPLLSYPDGIPLALTKKLLPAKSKLNLHVYLHLHLQAKLSQKPLRSNAEQAGFSKKKMMQLLKSLQQSVQSFSLDKSSGVWSAYYNEAAQRPDYLEQKKKIVAAWVSNLTLQTAFDAGANEGEFSRLLAEKGIRTISADFDHHAINKLYGKIKTENIRNIHPIILDLGSPSPAIGVNNLERPALSERLHCDLVLALAVLHHLAIGRNIGFEKIATMFALLGKKLIVEFVPKDDEKIVLMLQHKPDVYDWYSKEEFLAAFCHCYKIVAEERIAASGRALFLMQAIERHA